MFTDNNNNDNRWNKYTCLITRQCFFIDYYKRILLSCHIGGRRGYIGTRICFTCITRVNCQ